MLSSMVVITVPVICHANTSNHINKYEVRLGANRLVFITGTPGSAIAVSNPQPFPVIIQSRVFSEMQEKDHAFVITPPVFRLDAGQSTRLTLIPETDAFPSDRESLRWLCVKAVPPVNTTAEHKAGSEQSSLDLNVSLNNCIKLLTRPVSLSAPGKSTWTSVTWAVDHGVLHGINNTPYYISFSTVTAAGQNLDHPGYLSPFTTRSFSLKHAPGKGQNVTWSTIGDLGEKSEVFASRIQ